MLKKLSLSLVLATAAGLLAQAPAAKVTVQNFAFEPKEITIAAGSEVEWADEGGRHQVIADDGSFKSEVMAAGGHFKFKFEKAGRFAYHCMFHSHDMTGVVIVK
jgi:plastocyanin